MTSQFGLQMKYFERHIDWLLYIALTIVLFIECVWSHYSCTHSILIASFWKNPLAFWGFYLPKLFISMFFASFVFFVKHKWSVVVYSIIFNVWFWANCVYFRSYGNFIDAFALTMTGNMDGFWGAVVLFIERGDVVFFILSLLLAVFVWLMPDMQKRNWQIGIASLACSYLLCGIEIILPNYIYKSQYGSDSENFRFSLPPSRIYVKPFSKEARSEGMGISLEHDFSGLHYIGFDVVDFISIMKDRKNPYIMTDSDLNQVQHLLSRDTCSWNGSKQIIILVESLESWAIIPEVMPNVSALLKTPSFYAPHCKSQVRAGGSADGQFIINTGLLPIKEDAVCFRFPQNTFPTYPKGKSAVLIPHPIAVWNQVYMSPAYRYDTTFTCASEDMSLFHKAIEVLESGYDMIQIVTLTSHAPFKAGHSVDICLPDGLPSALHDYLGCLHLTDAGIGMFLNRIQNDSAFSNTTILITGDHTIFPQDRRLQYESTCLQNGIDYAVSDAFVPFVLVSPTITSSVLYSATCYQMDIYPTMLHAMGYTNHYWTGVGKDLLCPQCQRHLDEPMAYEISDKLIRANYFSNKN